MNYKSFNDLKEHDKNKIQRIFGPNSIVMQMTSAETEINKIKWGFIFHGKICFVNEFRASMESIVQTGVCFTKVDKG